MSVFLFSITQIKIISIISPFWDRLEKILFQLIDLKIPDFFSLAIILLFLIWLLIIAKKLEKRVRIDLEKTKTDILRLEGKKEGKKLEQAEEAKLREEYRKEEKIPEVEREGEIRVEERVEHKEPEKERVPEREEPARIIAIGEEEIFILSTIADEPEKMYQKERLFNLYKKAFSNKDRPHFNSDLNRLEKQELIKSGSVSDYIVWLEITDKGIEYLKKRRGN